MIVNTYCFLLTGIVRVLYIKQNRSLSATNVHIHAQDLNKSNLRFLPSGLLLRVSQRVGFPHCFQTRVWPSSHRKSTLEANGTTKHRMLFRFN